MSINFAKPFYSPLSKPISCAFASPKIDEDNPQLLKAHATIEKVVPLPGTRRIHHQ